MKVFARVLLLSLWLFAIVAPSAITLLDIDNPVIVTNLNEEEQQETGKKSPLQEKFVNDSFTDFSLIALSQKSLLGVYHPMGHVNFTQKILLPPPEHIS
ncbi:hypothetical protein GQ41_3815 [Arenibacter algicola]|jgi:hypothetical protein|uniref:Uncharacterized protein n=1 Tax=Arenibacter algicola TaxID=616991 RepID=A0A221UTV1_9FLAO|nr:MULTISPECIES: hypothetical protein [Arenibacter]ASO04526.1 hypothetical protein AREALGSMS7_01050 [Arenibacter algicola]GBF18103.1 hypothetical protein C21_00260 [Arenibacter sp. NBRC 103722]HCO84586.1 hypothetical protein [Arenibacter sp.]|tara:strand:- start:60357 stop:60653 length:297 start_codon:yes stop_codon:yes gene_type:complete